MSLAGTRSRRSRLATKSPPPGAAKRRGLCIRRRNVMATMVEEVGQSLREREVVDSGTREERIPEPCIVVIFGASGDLTKRKLLPALFHLEQQHLLPKEFVVVGVARRDLSATFAPDMQDGVLKGG